MSTLLPGAIDTATLGSILSRVRTQAAADPFSNPMLLFALDLTLRMDRGEIDLDSEQSQYRPEPALSYEIEHNTVFGPMLRLFDLARRIGTAITYEIGAIG